MRVARSVSIAIALSLLTACDRRSTPRDTGPGTDVTYLDTTPLDSSASPDARVSTDSGLDARELDANSLDARAPSDASAMDARAIDARAIDARAVDGSPIDARAVDARAIDARAADAPAPSPDALVADGGGAVLIECAPVVGSGATAGLLFSSNLWPGYRFQLASPGRARRVGLELTPDGASTVSAAIVALTGPSDTPDDPALGGADVLVRTDVSVPAASRPIVASSDLDFSLGAGWYALVFSTTTTGGTLPSGGGRGCVSTPSSGFPFTIRQSDGMFILQGAQPHLFVEVAP